MDTQERTLDNGDYQAPTIISRKGRKVHVQNYSPKASAISQGCEEMTHDIRSRSGGPNGQRITFHDKEAAEHFTKYVGRM
jgi:hypothetical protein